MRLHPIRIIQLHFSFQPLQLQQRSMMANLFLKPHHLPLSSLPPNFLFRHKGFFPTFSISHFSTLATPPITCTNQSQFPNPNLTSYGPSLHKGTNPSQFSLAKTRQQPQNDDAILHEESFTRVFDVAALRVPSAECFALESRLRGHLLNWPRIRNIARVPGDEVDPEVASLLGHPNNGDGDGEGEGGGEEEEEGSLVALHRRIYGKSEGDGDVLSPVLYRDKLAKTFSCRGFVKFRNLAKISRPKKKKKKGKKKAEGESDEGSKGIRKNGFAAVEVAEKDEEEEGSGDWKNLVGEGFRGRKWRGSTRLLLLDERYAGRGVEELPEAIKVAVPSL